MDPTGPPGGEHPAVRRGGPVFGPGAERSAGRGCVDADDSEDEAQRAAGGPGPPTSTRAERGALTDRMMADIAPRRERTSHVSSGHMGWNVLITRLQD